ERPMETSCSGDLGRRHRTLHFKHRAIYNVVTLQAFSTKFSLCQGCLDAAALKAEPARRDPFWPIATRIVAELGTRTRNTQNPAPHRRPGAAPGRKIRAAGIVKLLSWIVT